MELMRYMIRLKTALKALKKFISDYIEDILIFCGLAAIVTATFLLSFIAGMYVSGAILIGIGTYFARYPPGKKVK